VAERSGDTAFLPLDLQTCKPKQPRTRQPPPTTPIHPRSNPQPPGLSFIRHDEFLNQMTKQSQNPDVEWAWELGFVIGHLSIL
jgi:hypothetical protein